MKLKLSDERLEQAKYGNEGWDNYDTLQKAIDDIEAYKKELRRIDDWFFQNLGCNIVAALGSSLEGQVAVLKRKLDEAKLGFERRLTTARETLQFYGQIRCLDPVTLTIVDEGQRAREALVQIGGSHVPPGIAERIRMEVFEECSSRKEPASAGAEKPSK